MRIPLKVYILLSMNLSDPTLCACFNLRKATRAVTQLYDHHLRSTGLRCTQFSLLTLLREAGPLPMTQLAHEAVMDRTTMARNLEVLERDGLVNVSAGDDARVRVIELTRAGHARLDQAYPAWREAQRAIARALGDQRMTRLLGDLSTAVEAAAVT